MQTAWPVAIDPSGDAAVASVIWRRRGGLFVTVVVKGTFALIPNDAMVPIKPEPIFVTEQEAPGGGLRAADDLAPYLERTDVSLIGHAVAARTTGPRALPVRLAILRDRQVLLDKRVVVDVAGGGSAPGDPFFRAPIVNMGPMSRRWPVRSRLLGGADPRHLEGVFLQINEPFDWRYFQAAPADQRVEHLRGGEWVLLEGVHPTTNRLVSRLPAGRVFARVRGTAPLPAAWSALDLVLDALHVDADRRRCTVTWRGHFPAAGDHELSSLRVIAGFVAADSAHLSVDPRGATSTSDPRRVAPTQAPDLDPLAETMAFGEEAPSPAEEGDPLNGTLGLTEQTASEIAARPATPFREGSGPSIALALAALKTAPVHAPGGDVLGGTLGLTEETAAEIAARPATPFERDKGSPFTAPPAAAAEEDLLAGTLGLTEETAAEIAARPATPFQPGGEPSPSLFWIPAHAAPAREAGADPLGGTLGLRDETAAEVERRSVVPFDPRVEFPAMLATGQHEGAATAPIEAKPPPPPDGEEDMPPGLGDQFLAAMEMLQR